MLIDKLGISIKWMNDSKEVFFCQTGTYGTEDSGLVIMWYMLFVSILYYYITTVMIEVQTNIFCTFIVESRKFIVNW